MTLLEVDGIDVFYRRAQALHGVSLSVSQGEIVAVIGPNGAGKTTMLRAICGSIPVKRGEIVFDGNSTRGLRADQVAKRGVVLCPEGRRIWPSLTVHEHLTLGATARRGKGSVRADLEQIFGLFPVLEERLKAPAGTLSGGQQQMLAISRALIGRPQVLLCDEPSLGLAPLLVKQVLSTIAQLNSEGMTVLLVEQNAAGALGIAHRGYVLESGQIVASASADALAKDSRVQSAYLGVRETQ